MRRSLLLILMMSALAPSVQAAEKLALHALFKDKAILLIDGARRVLTTGETSPEGVKLIATDTREETAEIERDGRRQVLTLGVVASALVPEGKGRVMLFAESNGHYHTDGLINGKAVRFLVDTGATAVALSGAAAERIGIDYRRNGRPGIAQTAAGMVRTYNLTLFSVQVGDIVLYNVEAGVIEGNFPTEVLLGMSFLGQLDMKRDADKMELRQR